MVLKTVVLFQPSMHKWETQLGEQFHLSLHGSSTHNRSCSVWKSTNQNRRFKEEACKSLKHCKSSTAQSMLLWSLNTGQTWSSITGSVLLGARFAALSVQSTALCSFTKSFPLEHTWQLLHSTLMVRTCYTGSDRFHLAQYHVSEPDG